MSRARAEFVRAARCLEGSTVALAYAHSFDPDVLHAYYLRQRTETLSGYADVIDLLGAYPVFFNIDQFVELCTRPEQLAKIDFVLNVPGGSLNLDLLTLVGTLAGKVAKPVFPATATTISLGQNKEVARRLAHDIGWSVPQSFSFGEARHNVGALIVKPKSAGDSYGIRVLGQGERVEPHLSRTHMLEEFIRGYDLTTYVIFSPLTKRYEVLSSSITIPPKPDDKEWFWDIDSKFRSSGRGASRFEPLRVRREHCHTTDRFDELCCRTCEVFGVVTIARIDFRIYETADISSTIDIKDCAFLEINVLPSITTSGSWDAHISRHLEESGLSKHDVHELAPALPPMQAAMLFVLLSWFIQRGDVSATGVDQLK